MEDKIWFVILNDTHLGPFTLKELETKLKAGEITRMSLIWKVGLDRPQTYDLMFPKFNETKYELLHPKEKSNKPLYVLAICFFIFVMWFFNPNVELAKSELKLSRDYQEIKLNKISPLSCMVMMEARSIPDEIIGDDRVQFFSRAILQSNVGQFTNFEFLTGTRILPGYYQVRLKFYDCELDSWRYLIKVNAKDFDEIQNLVLLFEGDEKSFEPHLISYKKSKIEQQKVQLSEDSKALEDTDQKAETLRALSVQIEENYKVLFDTNLPWQKRVIEMTKNYTLKYGSFLNGFITLGVIPDVLSAESKFRIEEMHMKAKKLGFISMRLIEEAQAATKEIPDFQTKIESEFQKYRDELTNQSALAVEPSSAKP
jgi:hypothetical protein